MERFPQLNFCLYWDDGLTIHNHSPVQNTQKQSWEQVLQKKKRNSKKIDNSHINPPYKNSSVLLNNLFNIRFKKEKKNTLVFKSHICFILYKFIEIKHKIVWLDWHKTLIGCRSKHSHLTCTTVPTLVFVVITEVFWVYVIFPWLFFSLKLQWDFGHNFFKGKLDEYNIS